MFVCCCRKYLIPPEHLAHDLPLHWAEVGVVAVPEGEVEEGGVGGELVAELRAAHALHHRHEPAPPAPRPHRTPLILVLSSSSTLTSILSVTILTQTEIGTYVHNLCPLVEVCNCVHA